MDKDPAQNPQQEREPIGAVDTWIDPLRLDAARFGSSTPEQTEQAAATIQAEMTAVAKHLNTSMVGFYQPGDQPRLVLTRWPEDREGSVVPKTDECEAARDELAAALEAEEDDRPVIPPGGTVVLLGTMAEYSDEQAVTVDDIADNLPDCDVSAGNMVYVRIANGEVAEEWSEPVGVVQAGHVISWVQSMIGLIKAGKRIFQSMAINRPVCTRPAGPTRVTRRQMLKESPIKM